MPLRPTLLEIYRGLEKIIAPGLKYAPYLYGDVLNAHVNSDVDWLDVGCGHHILPLWRGEEERSMYLPVVATWWESTPTWRL